MSDMYERNIDDLIEVLKRANRDGLRINLLIGAGVSVSGSIPLAIDIMKDIETKFPREISRVKDKSYAEYMCMLTSLERRKLISEYVENSKVNLAHLLIAHLMRKKIVNCVLTTNFDNLLIRSCAFTNCFPGVYDLAASKSFRTDMLFDNAIIHLHGQYTGFVLCNTENELNTQLEIIRPTFIELNKNSMWIVIGYSGKNDPIVELFKEYKNSDNRLYWIGYKDEEPNEDIKELFINKEKYCYYVKGYDADSFFSSLCKKLDAYPADIINTPFTHLYNIVDTMTLNEKYDEENEDLFLGVKNDIEVVKKFITQAINNYEKDNVIMAKYYYDLGFMERFKDIFSKVNRTEKEEILEINKENNKKMLEKAKEYLDRVVSNPQEAKIGTLKTSYILISIFEKEINLEKYIKEILSILEKCEEKDDDSEVMWFKIELLKDLARYEKDIELFMRVLKVLDELSKIEVDEKFILKERISVYEDISIVLEKNSEEALKYLDKALNLIEENQDILGKLYINLSKSKIYLLKIKLSKENFIYLGNVFECIRNILEEKIDDSNNIELGELFKNILKLIFNSNMDKDNIQYTDKILEVLKKSLKNIDSFNVILAYLINLKNIIDNEENINGTEELLVKLSEVINSFKYDNLSGLEKNDTSQVLNELAYILINKKEFKCSKSILDKSIELGKNTYNTATLGLYYIFALSDPITGEGLYEEAIKIEKDSIIQQAVEQKKNSELAKYFKEKNEVLKAKEYINKAIKIGQISDDWKVYYEESLVLSKEIEEMYKEIDENNLIQKEINNN